jgi:hypothetical protein
MNEEDKLIKEFDVHTGSLLRNQVICFVAR